MKYGMQYFKRNFIYFDSDINDKSSIAKDIKTSHLKLRELYKKEQTYIL